MQTRSFIDADSTSYFTQNDYWLITELFG